MPVGQCQEGSIGRSRSLSCVGKTKRSQYILCRSWRRRRRVLRVAKLARVEKEKRVRGKLTLNGIGAHTHSFMLVEGKG